MGSAGICFQCGKQLYRTCQTSILYQENRKHFIAVYPQVQSAIAEGRFESVLAYAQSTQGNTRTGLSGICMHRPTIEKWK
jgi:hypothetical protein